MALHVDDVDAAFVGKTISDFIRDAVSEKIEDQQDLATLRAAVAEDEGGRYTQAQVLVELGL